MTILSSDTRYDPDELDQKPQGGEVTIYTRKLHRHFVTLVARYYVGNTLFRYVQYFVEWYLPLGSLLVTLNRAVDVPFMADHVDDFNEIRLGEDRNEPTIYRAEFPFDADGTLGRADIVVTAYPVM